MNGSLHAQTPVADRYVADLSAAVFFAELPAELRTTGPDGLPTTAPRMPWIERYELRTETRDLDPASQEYALRLIPNTPGKRRAQNRLAGLVANGTTPVAADLRKARVAYVADRYAAWLTAYGLERELALLDQLATVLRDRQTVLERRAAAYGIDWSDFVSVRIERTDLQLRRAALRADQRQLLARYGFAYDRLDHADLVALDSLPLPAARLTALDARYARERDLLRAERDLEVAEQRQYLDFVQFKFQGPRDDLFRERFSVGLGLQLPNRGNTRLKLQELDAELRTLAVEETVERFTAQRKLTVLRYEARLRRERYADRRAAYAREAAELAEVARRLQTAAAPNPELLLRLREHSLRNELQLLEARIDLGKDYLDLLEEGGWFDGEDRGAFLRRDVQPGG